MGDTRYKIQDMGYKIGEILFYFYDSTKALSS